MLLRCGLSEPAVLHTERCRGDSAVRSCTIRRRTRTSCAAGHPCHSWTCYPPDVTIGRHGGRSWGTRLMSDPMWITNTSRRAAKVLCASSGRKGTTRGFLFTNTTITWSINNPVTCPEHDRRSDRNNRDTAQHFLTNCETLIASHLISPSMMLMMRNLNVPVQSEHVKPGYSNNCDLSRSGFSLLELLVVVGILSALIGLAIPVLSQARHRAKTIHCLSEMRQLGSLVTMYTNENAEYLPFLYRRAHDSQSWVTPNGNSVPEGFLETAGDLWAYPMADQFGNNLLDERLLCPFDWVSSELSNTVALEHGVQIQDVLIPMNRTISRAFYRSPLSLSDDGLMDHAPVDERRMKISSVQYPSAKSLLVEDPPFHDDFHVSRTWNITAESPHRNVIVASDLSVDIRSLDDALPGVVPSIQVPSGYPGDVLEYLESQRQFSSYHYTRDGVLGRDW